MAGSKLAIMFGVAAALFWLIGAFDQAKPSVIRSARTVGHSQTPRLLAVPESAETRM